MGTSPQRIVIPLVVLRETCILASLPGLALSGSISRHMGKGLSGESHFLTTTNRLMQFNEPQYRSELFRCPMLDLSSATPQVRPSAPHLRQMRGFAATLSGIQQRQAFAMDRQCSEPREINGQEGPTSRAIPNQQGPE